MRFPIRAQILFPMSIVMVTAVLGSFLVNVWLAQRSVKGRIQQRFEDVTTILEGSTFPLTDRVLQQMAGLTGADFVLVDDAGNFLGTSAPSLLTMETLGMDWLAAPNVDEVSTIAERQYFHRVMALSHARSLTILRLHAFFPADEYRRIWQRSLMPTFIAAGTAFVAALGCAYWVGGSVSQSTQEIVGQLRNISQGKFSKTVLPRRDDELRDIASEINHTAEMLEQYEEDLRDNERMKTMVAMGAGIAHQIRNSATGCRMALDILDEGEGTSRDEALVVARRQLSLMENYVQRFLLLAKVEPNRIEWTTTDLRETVKQAVSLVRHSAQHLGVVVQSCSNNNPQPVKGDQVAIEQAIINLLLNATEAASSTAVDAEPDGKSTSAQVRIEIRNTPDDTAEVIVADTGAGPPTGEDVFAAFVSQKKSGVGLGLAVVKEVALEHGGSVSWRRSGNWTEFVLTLPLAAEGVT